MDCPHALKSTLSGRELEQDGQQHQKDLEEGITSLSSVCQAAGAPKKYRCKACWARVRVLAAKPLSHQRLEPPVPPHGKRRAGAQPRCHKQLPPASRPACRSSGPLLASPKANRSHGPHLRAISALEPAKRCPSKGTKTPGDFIDIFSHSPPFYGSDSGAGSSAHTPLM